MMIVSHLYSNLFAHHRYIFPLSRVRHNLGPRSRQRSLDFGRFSRRASGFPRAQNQVDGISHASSVLYAGEDCGTIPSHEFRISAHNSKGCGYQWGDVDLLRREDKYTGKGDETHFVDHKKIRMGDTRSSLARDFVTTLGWM